MKLNLFKAACCCLLFFGVHEAEASTVDLERKDGSKITVHLKQRAPENSEDLLVLLQGSDCNSVVHNERMEVYSQVLPEADVLTVEKYGITPDLRWDLSDARTDCPVSYIENDSPERRTVDYIKVIRHLKEKRDYKRVYLIGGSEGAMVASMIAARTDLVTASIALNGGGRKFLNTILYNIKQTARSKEEETKNTEGFKGFAAHVMNNKPFDLNMGDHGYTWWRFMLDSDQLEILAQVDSPLLIVQGGRDINVSPQAVEEQISKLREIGKSNITYRSYAELDHFFKTPDGVPMDEQVISEIQQWLAQLD